MPQRQSSLIIKIKFKVLYYTTFNIISTKSYGCFGTQKLLIWVLGSGANCLSSDWFMRCEIKSGNSTFFWFDNWLGTGSIINITWDLGLLYLGIPRQARVAEVCPNKVWGMQSRGRRVFGDVYTAIENVQKPDAWKKTMLFYGGTMRRTTRTTSQQWELEIRLEIGGLKYLGTISFGLHKEYHAMLSLFG